MYSLDGERQCYICRYFILGPRKPDGVEYGGMMNFPFIGTAGQILWEGYHICSSPECLDAANIAIREGEALEKGLPVEDFSPPSVPVVPDLEIFVAGNDWASDIKYPVPLGYKASRVPDNLEEMVSGDSGCMD